MIKSPIDVQGHRGARGVYPENTIPGFIYALEAGVNTIELDVVVSYDKKIVVSHEPWMSAAICSHPNGDSVKGSEEKSLNLYKMLYDEIASYDCGKRGNSKFPQQKTMPVYKPLLSAVIDSIEKTIRAKKLKPIQYNIEIKSMPKGDDDYHPKPEEFAKLVLDVIRKFPISDRVIVQSFDVRPLKKIRKINPEIKLAMLVAVGSMSTYLRKLNFTPEVYSPNFRLVGKKLVTKAHNKGMKVIPWTVNDESEMRKQLEYGVDGIITDYPEVLIKLLAGL